MARNRVSYPNLERAVVAWLKAETGLTVYTETPPDLAAHVPCYRVARAGGGDQLELGKEVQIEVAAYGRNRADLWNAAAAAETAMDYLAANGAPGFYVDDVRETFGFAAEPYENDGVRKATATYGLTVRPHPHNQPTEGDSHE